MAIGSLQLPGAVQPLSFDFQGSLSELGKTYQKAQADQLKQQTLSTLGQGGKIDGAALQQAGIRLGDMSLASLGTQLQNTEYQHGRDDKNDTRQAAQDALSQQHWQASFGLQQRAANRADDPTPANFVKDPTVPGGYRPIGPADPDYQATLARKKAEAEASVPGSGGASLNPIYGVGPDGKPAVMQLTKTGKAIQTEQPQGFQISREPIKIDNGTYYTLLDPQTRQTVGTLPKNVAATEAEKVTGDATGQAQVALPTVIANAEQGLKTIDLVKNHPGKKYGLGVYSALPTVPGTPQADFRAAADQLKGQTFLQAYTSLKGSGAITDIEGKKGENAIARLDQAQTTEAYDAALDDLKSVISGGVNRAKFKARGAGSSAPAPSQADPLGIR